MDVEPSDSIPDLGSVWQSGNGHLCFSRVIPVPALVLPEFPDDSGHRCLRPPMAELISTNKADSGSTMQSKGEQCPSPSHSPILALPDLVLGVNSPLVSVPLGDSDQAGLTVPAPEQDLASPTRALEVVGIAHSGPRAVMDVLNVEVQETIASARAPATRKLYSSKWGVFESWCLTRAIDPVNCPVGPVLEFLQERMTAGAAATTLRVYVAAIAARRELDEIPLGRHRLVSAFMRGVRRLRPARPTAIPSWDLSVVSEGLVTAPFEPLESASKWILTLKVILLLALTFSLVQSFISGPLPARGTNMFSRLLGLNTWLQRTCRVNFIDNFNIFWGHRQLFKLDGLHPNKLGARVLKDNFYFSLRHPSVVCVNPLTQSPGQNMSDHRTSYQLPSHYVVEESHKDTDNATQPKQPLLMDIPAEPCPQSSSHADCDVLQQLQDSAPKDFLENSLGCHDNTLQSPETSELEPRSPDTLSLSPASPLLSFSQKMEELVYAGTKLSASPQISTKKRRAPQPPKTAGSALPPPPVRALRPLPQRKGPNPPPSAVGEPKTTDNSSQ